MFNPAKAAEEIKKEYMGYIATTYHFRNPLIQSQLENELNKTVSNGPFVEIKDTFKTGKSIGQLIDAGILSPLFRELEQSKTTQCNRSQCQLNCHPKLPVDRPLYLHQERAIRKIVSGENVVVSTGTGSGKTHCFLIPVLNELLREQEAGILDDGVRAIFIYPMNALANDQIKGLREILLAYPQITFGVYNGETEYTEKAAVQLYEAMYANEKCPELQSRLKNEMLSRLEMKKHPPHILFTNYAMLEHLLFRPGDDVLFSKANFKFVVLDEAHVYGGAVGIETALLMGRLKARLGDSKPQFILTSATLGDQSSESKERVVGFASKLTGCDFKQENIVYADRIRQYCSGTYTYPEKLFEDLAAEERPVKQTLTEYNIAFDSTRADEEILYDLIIESDIYATMREQGGLISLDDFAENLHMTRQTAVAFISQCAKAKKGGKLLLDIRYHYFLRALDGGYMALDYPQSFTLTRKDKYNGEIKMFEVGVCDDCGELAIIGKRDEGTKKLVRAGISDVREYYQIVGDGDEEEFEDIDEQSEADRKPAEKFVLCKNCGAIIEENQSHKLIQYIDYKSKVEAIKDGPKHASPFGKGFCANTKLNKYSLHHEFKTDVAKVEFETDTSDYATMLSVMYGLLNAFADVLSIEKRDVKACLTYKLKNGEYSHQIIIYDSVPGGAGHSRRLITESGDVLKAVINRAVKILSECDCDPSCYKCLRSYENQKVHETLDRNKALAFLSQLVD